MRRCGGAHQGPLKQAPGEESGELQRNVLPAFFIRCLKVEDLGVEEHELISVDRSPERSQIELVWGLRPARPGRVI